MQYRVDLRRVAQRRIEVELQGSPSDLGVPSAAGVPGPDDLVFFLPVWTPGSYLVREFSRHVSGVRATTAGDVPLPVRKVGKNRWAVRRAGLEESLTLRWSVYAHELSVRTAYATDLFAYWNGACVLLWPAGAEQLPATVEVALPAGWRLFAGSRDVVADRNRATFRTADLDEAVDTPCLAGAFEAWSFDLGGREHRFVAAGLAGVEPPASFRDDVMATVSTTAAVFGGELPFDRYTFLALFSGDGRGGLEHLDSSTLLAPRTTFRPRGSYEDFLALIAHEYLHAWNVRRMRPQEFGRFDYDRENHTRLLWVAEGFTAYYDDLIVRRAGLSKPTAYLERLGSHLRALASNPGRRVQSLGDASYDAWILLYRPDENTRNATQNYYTNGALAALVLDSEIRRSSGGARSLDDALRRLWRSSFVAGRGYTYDDVVRCIDAAAGRSLGELVHALTERDFEPDLAGAFALYGLRIDEPDDDVPFLGIRFKSGETQVASVEDQSPAWHGGLCPADEVLAVDALRVTGSTWGSVWENVARAGATARLLIARHGIVRELEVVPTARPIGTPRIVSVRGPTESQLAHRESWLGTRSL